MIRISSCYLLKHTKYRNYIIHHLLRVLRHRSIIMSSVTNCLPGQRWDYSLSLNFHRDMTHNTIRVTRVAGWDELCLPPWKIISSFSEVNVSTWYRIGYPKEISFDSNNTNSADDTRSYYHTHIYICSWSTSSSISSIDQILVYYVLCSMAFVYTWIKNNFIFVADWRILLTNAICGVHNF